VLRQFACGSVGGKKKYFDDCYCPHKHKFGTTLHNKNFINDRHTYQIIHLSSSYTENSLYCIHSRLIQWHFQQRQMTGRLDVLSPISPVLTIPYYSLQISLNIYAYHERLSPASDLSCSRFPTTILFAFLVRSSLKTRHTLDLLCNLLKHRNVTSTSLPWTN
jgi:hypothetical protein